MSSRSILGVVDDVRSELESALGVTITYDPPGDYVIGVERVRVSPGGGGLPKAEADIALVVSAQRRDLVLARVDNVVSAIWSVTSGLTTEVDVEIDIAGTPPYGAVCRFTVTTILLP